MMADHRYSHRLFKGRRSSLAIAARGASPYVLWIDGNSWESITDTLSRNYAVPVRVHPNNSKLLYLGVAEEAPPLWLNRGSKAHGALMRSDGSSWWAVFQIPIRA